MAQPQRTYTNPFYASSPAPTAQSPPPSYNHSTRPNSNQPQQSAEPIQYGSLSQLNSNRAPPPPPRQSYDYQPNPERQGYRPQPPSTSTTNTNTGAGSGGVGAGGRRLPPLGSGMMRETPAEPPRRNVATSPVAPTQPSYLKQAQSYIPAGAQSTIGTAADKVNDTWRSVATNERKDQVMSGLGKLGAGAAKLTAKGAYQIGKFASK